MLMGKELMEVVVTSMALSGHGNLLCELGLPNKGPLPAFGAGAHIDLHLQNGMVRQYSLCGQLDNSNTYQICVRLDAGSKGGSIYIHQHLRVGDRLQISHPRHFFTLPDAGQYLLFAGGIGITPLLSMAEAIAGKGGIFELHYYAAHKDDMALADRLQLDHLRPNVHLHESAKGDSLRHHTPPCLLQPPYDKAILTCGPLGFMRRIKETAIANGWDASQYYCEQFRNEEVSTDESAAHGFAVKIASTGDVFEIPPDKTIAEVLTDNGVSVDLSCEQGMCGACLTKVLAGIPEHCDVVQSDAEKASNQFMTLCCSRAKTDLLVLDL